MVELPKERGLFTRLAEKEYYSCFEVYALQRTNDYYEKWQGQNLLGFSLMYVRSVLVGE